MGDFWFSDLINMARPWNLALKSTFHLGVVSGWHYSVNCLSLSIAC